MMLQVYNDGLRNMNLYYILNKLCLPVVCVLGMMLALPYIIAKSFLPALGKNTLILCWKTVFQLL